MLLQEGYFYFTSRALICSILEYCSPVFIPLYQVMISYLSEKTAKTRDEDSLP